MTQVMETVVDLVGDLISMSEADWSGAPVSQSSIAERQFLHSYVRDHYEGAGEIVELGVGGGGTAYAICLGLQENKIVREKNSRVHLFDWFSFEPGHYASKVFFRHDHDESKGNSFEFDVIKNLEAFDGTYKIYNGDIGKVEFDIGDIEILHIDVAKTFETFECVVSRFFHKLMTGKSLILHQDFASPSLSWIHYSTSMLLPYVDVLSLPIRSTLPLRLRERIPDDIIASIVQDKISPEDKVELIQRLKQHITVDRSGTLPYEAVFDMSCAFVWHRHGDYDQAQHWVRKCENVPYIVERRSSHIKQLKAPIKS